MMMPPAFYPPPPPQKSGGGFARAIFTTLATTILGLSLALNVYLLIFSGVMKSSSGARAETIIDGDYSQQVAVYPIHGIIDDDMSRQFDKELTEAEKDSTIKAIVLHIDTPGGGVTASDEIYARILRFKESKKVPVVATMASLGTSGGYYIACAADHVFAEETTLTGNIGVLQEGFNVSELCQKWGIKETTIVPEGAPYKNAGSMFQPERPEDVKYMRDMVEQAFGRFKLIVKQGRGSKLAKPIDQIANGKVYQGPDARKLGLVDDIGYAHDAYTKAAGLANLSNMRVVMYERMPSLFGLFGATKTGSTPSASSIGSLNIGASDVHFNSNTLRELLTPKLLYLGRGR